MINSALQLLKYIIIIIIIFLFNFPIKAGSKNLDSQSIIVLESLDLQNDILKALRKDVRTAIIVIKNNGNPEKLPDLKFFKYKLKKDENFWNILSRTSLNMDTISTINFLSSPNDIYPGKEIILSNIRGIVYKIKKDDTIEKISKIFNIEKKYVSKINKLDNNNSIIKEYIFIPSGELSNIERSLFLGVGFASPLKKFIRSSSFGRRIDPFNNKFHPHSGIDLSCPSGTNVYAARKGIINFTGCYKGYGLLVIIKHENNYYTYYGHLKKILVKKGDFVERGEQIALSGNTGRSTGPHLHFEVRKEVKPINPGVLLR